VRPAWRQRIRFVQYNLADGRLPPALADADLILCRNVLMYFSTGRALAAVRRLLGSLSADGVLLLSAVEASLATQAGLVGSWAGCNYALAPTARQEVRVSSPAPRRAFAAEQVVLGKAGPLYPKQTSGEARQPAPAANPAIAEQLPAESTDAIRERRWQQVARAQVSGQHEQIREASQAYLSCPGLSRSQQHQACLAMAQSWADQQRPEQAQEWLQRALALNSDSPKAYWLQALLAQQSGDLRLAQAALQKALYLDPEFILGYFLRARLLRAEGQTRAGEKALQVCRQLLLAQDVASLVPQGDGLSCVQLLRLCDQLLEEPSGCPSH
jgi:chemotaxis protein methyltransferase CheR